MPRERWVVTGTLMFRGLPTGTFEYPGDGTCEHWMSEAPTRAEAEETVRRMTRRGHVVALHREVWDGPAAGWRKG